MHYTDNELKILSNFSFLKYMGNVSDFSVNENNDLNIILYDEYEKSGLLIYRHFNLIIKNTNEYFNQEKLEGIIDKISINIDLYLSSTYQLSFEIIILDKLYTYMIIDNDKYLLKNKDFRNFKDLLYLIDRKMKINKIKSNINV